MRGDEAGELWGQLSRPDWLAPPGHPSRTIQEQGTLEILSYFFGAKNRSLEVLKHLLLDVLVTLFGKFYSKYSFYWFAEVSLHGGSHLIKLDPGKGHCSLEELISKLSLLPLLHYSSTPPCNTQCYILVLILSSYLEYLTLLQFTIILSALFCYISKKTTLCLRRKWLFHSLEMFKWCRLAVCSQIDVGEGHSSNLNHISHLRYRALLISISRKLSNNGIMLLLKGRDISTF